MVGSICGAIFSLAALMQMGWHFSLPCHALRMINLDAPQMALQGDTIQLSCSYSLITAPGRSPRDRREILATRSSGSELANEAGGTRRTRNSPPQLDVIYAVKWYRDEREFFRFLAQDWPHKQAFPADGLNIDVEKSDNQTVVLRNVSLKTSGLFRCEVSTDAPSFLTKSIERKLPVYHLPNEGPTLEQLNRDSNRLHYLGDRLSFRCSSSESKPAAQIDWIIDEILNLTETRSLPFETTEKPTFKIETKRVVRIPAPPPGTRAQGSSARSLDATTHWPEASRSEPASPPDPVTRQWLTVSYEPRDAGAQAATGPATNLTNPISLTAHSLQQLLETAISWLNFTVDANLLQHLASASDLPRKSSADFARTARKTVVASANYFAVTDHTSRGSAALKTRQRTGELSTWQKRRPTPNGSKWESRVSLRVRCVARAMHLSLSDDIRLRLVNKTRDRAAQDVTASSARRVKLPLANNPGSRRNSPGRLWLAGSAYLTAKMIISQGSITLRLRVPSSS